MIRKVKLAAYRHNRDRLHTGYALALGADLKVGATHALSVRHNMDAPKWLHFFNGCTLLYRDAYNLTIVRAVTGLNNVRCVSSIDMEFNMDGIFVTHPIVSGVLKDFSGTNTSGQNLRRSIQVRVYPLLWNIIKDLDRHMPLSNKK